MTSRSLRNYLFRTDGTQTASFLSSGLRIHCNGRRHSLIRILRQIRSCGLTPPTWRPGQSLYSKRASIGALWHTGSKKFNLAQRAYAPFDKELLAASSAVTRFQDLVESQPVILRTDHKPIVGAITKKSDRLTPFQRRHLAWIAQFVQSVEYRCGAENQVADALSRIYDNGDDSVSACNTLISCTSTSPSELALQQSQDADLKNWVKRHSENRNSQYCPRQLNVMGCLLWTVEIKDRTCVLVPTSLQRPIFDAVHRAAHHGAKATERALKEQYFWPTYRKDVRKWCKSCENCQTNKITRHTRSPLTELPKPTRRFADLHIDLVGPLLPACESKNGLLTIIDKWTGWPEAIPISLTNGKASAQTCAKLLIKDWISKFGITESITSDRGPQFVSSLWTEIAQLLDVRLHKTTSYHPQANGWVERMHRSLKDALRCRLNGRKNWLSHLPWALLGLRSRANTDTGIAPAEMVIGELPTLPGLFVARSPAEYDESTFTKQLRDSIQEQGHSNTKWHKSHSTSAYVPDALKTCKKVLLRRERKDRSLAPKYTGSHDVLERSSKSISKLQ